MLVATLLIASTPIESLIAWARDDLLGEEENVVIDLGDKNLGDSGPGWELTTEGDLVIKDHLTLVGEGDLPRLHINNGATVIDDIFRDNITPLQGAEFSLFEWNDAINDWRGEPNKVVESGADGLISFTGLTVGSRYLLIETDAPDGYVRPVGYWIINVLIDGTTEIETFGDGQPEFIDSGGVLHLPNIRDDDPGDGGDGPGDGGDDPGDGGDDPGDGGDDPTNDDDPLICIEGQTLIILPVAINLDEIEIEATPGWTYEFILTESGHYIIVIDPPAVGLVPTDEVIITFPVGVMPDDVIVCLADSSLTYETNIDPETGEFIAVIKPPADDQNRPSDENDQRKLPQTGISALNRILAVIGLVGIGIFLGVKRIIFRILNKGIDES